MFFLAVVSVAVLIDIILPTDVTLVVSGGLFLVVGVVLCWL